MRLHLKIFVVLAIAPVWCSLAQSAAKPKTKAPTLSADLSTPEKTVRLFVKSLNSGDLNAAAACVQDSKPKTPDLTEMWRINHQMRLVYALEKAKFTTKNNNAIADLEVKIGQGKDSAKRAEKLNLTRQGKAWKIVPPAKTVAFQPNSGLLLNQVDVLVHPKEYIAIFNRAKAIAQKYARQNKAKAAK